MCLYEDYFNLAMNSDKVNIDFINISFLCIFDLLEEINDHEKYIINKIVKFINYQFSRVMIIHNYMKDVQCTIYISNAKDIGERIPPLVL